MPVHERLRLTPIGTLRYRNLPHAFYIIASAVIFFMVAFLATASGEGILEGITGNVEMDYNFVSTKTTDASGNTTKTQINNYNPKLTLNLNYDLYPKLNLNAGGTFEENITDPLSGEGTAHTELRRVRPFIWLTFRDPIYRAALGYDKREDTLKVSGLSKTTLIQDNYNANLEWRPEAFPRTQVFYTRTNTYDEPRSSLDTQKDYVNLKSEYVYRGLDVTYFGTYVNTQDKIRNFDSTELSNEGRLIYATTFFNGRTSFNTDDRLNVTKIDTTNAGQGQVGVPVFPFAGLSALSDTPLNGTLAANPAMIDGNLTASAGVNIGLPPLGGDTRRRNVGLDFLTSVELNALLVWVDRELPQDIANSFSWDIYTSTDNLNWTFYRTVPVATFGPFLNRFEIDFPNVTTRYIKVVTKPLSATVLDASKFPDIFITEIQPFLNTPAASLKNSTTRIFQDYTVDVKTRLLNTVALYHDLNAYYIEQEPNGQKRYNVSNGLFFTQTLTPILSTSDNASVEIGSEENQTRIAFLYYASLLATPLKTLTNSLVFSGNNEILGGLTSRSNSVVLYNTAQLYKGIDAVLNLGAVFTSQEQEAGNTLRRTDLYVNPGVNLTPHPSMALTLYYLGKKSHASGGPEGSLSDVTENRVDLGASWTPFRTVFLSATVSADSETGKKTTVLQNYGLNWAPFPDGQLQFSFFYNENYFPGRSRLFQPTVRWYFSVKRRSYLDLSYQWNNTEAAGQKTQANIVSTTLKIFF